MKNLIFDLGGVLLKGTAASILDKMTLNDEEYNSLLEFFKDWDNLDLGIETLEDKYSNCKFDNIIDNKYKEELLNYYKKREINMDLIDLARILKTNGYNLYILSDNNSDAAKYYYNNEIFNIFDGWVISCDYQTMKKDGKLFEILLDKYHLEPKESYFIDDNPTNVRIARQYGITGYIYNEKDDINFIYKDMRDNGINI